MVRASVSSAFSRFFAVSRGPRASASAGTRLGDSGLGFVSDDQGILNRNLRRLDSFPPFRRIGKAGEFFIDDLDLGGGLLRLPFQPQLTIGKIADRPLNC